MGDLLLLGARPGEGKTVAALQLLLDAAREGRKAVFFTLDIAEAQASDLIHSLAGDRQDDCDRVEIVTSDDISAHFIVRHLSDSPAGTVAVVDYLQVLDQQRTRPPLSEQIAVLQDFAARSGVILCFISQVHRSFVAAKQGVPGLDDVRLPNPLDLAVFSKCCFLHGGELRFHG